MEYRSPQPASAPTPTPHHPAPAPTKKKRSIKKPNNTGLWLGILIVILALIGVSAYSYNKYQDSKLQVQKLNNKLNNPQAVAQAEQTELVTKVGKITVLPAGETPTIATVSDISKLKDQAFFVNAQNGDKVLIYTKAKKAYLYRPSTNKIINIAPVNLGDQSSSSTPTNTTTTKP
jgi:hypothetical protein